MSSGLRQQNDAIRAEMDRLIGEAAEQGRLKGADPALFVFAGRALAYGMARMYVDGQFPSWELDEAAAEQLGGAALDLFIGALVAPAPP